MLGEGWRVHAAADAWRLPPKAMGNLQAAATGAASKRFFISLRSQADLLPGMSHLVAGEALRPAAEGSIAQSIHEGRHSL